MKKNILIVILGIATVVSLYIAVVQRHSSLANGDTPTTSSLLDMKVDNMEKTLKRIEDKLGSDTSSPNNLKFQDDTIATWKTDIAALKTTIAALIEEAVTNTTGKIDAFQRSNTERFQTLDSRVADVSNKLDALCQPKSEVPQTVEDARLFMRSGDFASAGLYWQNALEHAQPSELLSLLKEYAKTVFESVGEDFSRYPEIVALERMAAVATVKVPPNEILAARDLHDKCVKFRDSLLALANANEDDSIVEHQQIHPAEEMANAVDSILREMEETINSYAPGDGEKPTDAEYKILQLSGVAENAMSQLWLLDRSALSSEQRSRIDTFPGRLNGLLDKFNARHDTPILSLIVQLEHSAQRKSTHQANIDSLTNQIARIVDKTKILRGTPAQETAQKTVVALQDKVANERRQQMNEYQLFVANCCMLAYECKDDIMSGAFEDSGAIFDGRDYSFKDVNDFIEKKVRSYSQIVKPSDLKKTKNGHEIYASDHLIAAALSTQKPEGKKVKHKVSNAKKAFIVLAVYGFFRIDQTLLTPETSRLFNDIFAKYYEKLEKEDKVKSVRWMVEEPKIRLEDF